MDIQLPGLDGFETTAMIRQRERTRHVPVVFLTALGSVLVIGLRKFGQMADPRLQGMRAALLAAVSGALVTGLLDHYFANQAFPHAVALFWLYAAALVNVSLAASPVRQREPERAAQSRPAAFRTHTPAV